MEIREISQLATQVKENINKVIVGKSDVIDLILTAVLAGGHILLEDVPGTGKTVLAKSLARSLDCSFKRIQFTPDILPSDVTGMSVFNQQNMEFEFKPGPIFTNVVLADEINRATPRSQSALLECMEERQVTIDGVTRPMATPFLVIATQNPVEIQGTFPLPEAQVDRFLIKLKMGYPSEDDAVAILDRFMRDNPIEQLSPVAGSDQIIAAQQAARKVTISPAVLRYICQIVEQTRALDQVVLGVSPRGSLALMRACQVWAALHDRDFVTPDDVRQLCRPVLAHRLVVRSSYGKTDLAEQAIDEALRLVAVPTEDIA